MIVGIVVVDRVEDRMMGKEEGGGIEKREGKGNKEKKLSGKAWCVGPMGVDVKLRCKCSGQLECTVINWHSDDSRSQGCVFCNHTVHLSVGGVR